MLDRVDLRSQSQIRLQCVTIPMRVMRGALRVLAVRVKHYCCGTRRVRKGGLKVTVSDKAAVSTTNE